MTTSQIQQQALTNATSQNSESNYDAIFEGFIEKGLSEEDIIPRENIFTYNAWKALNRQVKKGEHGVKIVTWIPCTKKDKKTGEKESYRRPKTTTVFHISQTDILN